MAKVLSLPISEISLNSAHFYEGGARGDASVMGIWDDSRPRVSRGTKSQKQVQTAQNAAQRPAFWTHTAEQPAFGRIGEQMRTMRAAHG